MNERLNQKNLVDKYLEKLNFVDDDDNNNNSWKINQKFWICILELLSVRNLYLF